MTHTAARTLKQLNDEIVACERCPRLVAWCRQTAKDKRKAFANDTYHGKPVPNFGDLRRGRARMLIVGLAPAAHGANRTGRMFTGDRSGDFLFARLHETGFANQAESIDSSDGLTLNDAVITAACHCAPPANKPTREELENCASYLARTIDLMPNLRVVFCLGKIGLDAALREYRRRGWIETMSQCTFGHGAAFTFDDVTDCKHKHGVPAIVCSFHPSQQNTFTGRLTEQMMRDAFETARELMG